MAITKIQDTDWNNGAAVGSVTSASCTTHFSTATTAGSLLIAFCIVHIDNLSAPTPIPTINTPTASGFTWTLARDSGASAEESASGTTNRSRVAMFYIANAASMGTGVLTTCSVSTAGATHRIDCSIDLFEFGGLSASSVLDSTAGAVGISKTPSAGNITTSDVDLVFVGGYYNQFDGGAGAGFTLTQNSFPSGTQDIRTCTEYILNSSITTYTATFGTDPSGPFDAPWGCVAAAFFNSSHVSGSNGTSTPAGVTAASAENNPSAIGTSGDGGGGGSSDGGVTGCGDCQGPHLLQLIPGFSDLPNSVLSADDPAFALHLGEIAMNATFGMVRMEVFPCLQKHGDTVPLPRSCWDGYKYSREELNYFWTVQNSTDPSTRWISGPDSLWFSNWNVNQSTGEVFSEEWYERSSTADTRLAAKSNDGSLMIFCVGQRQKTNMIIVSPPSYTSISESTIATDKPYTQDLVKHLNDNAKFSCINTEFFYLGEYVDGNTVQLAASAVDGYEYSAAECQFLHAWRWTADGTDYVQPPGQYEQAAPFQASIDPSGLVSITVTFSTSGGEGVLTAPAYGRIAAFAFCRRSATPASSPLADDFTELDLGFFFPGRTVRASELLTIKHNIDEAILSPEFFGPTEYRDEDVVPLPVSTVDGYAYSREEVQYIWSWSDTTNNAGGSHVRLPLFFGSVDPESGTVKLRTWRLPPGGPLVDDENGNAIIRVIVMATRQALHPLLTLGVINDDLLVTPADSGTLITDDSGDLINGT